MAGAMRKMGVYLGLVEDDDRYDYDEYGEYDERSDRGERVERVERRAVHPVREESRVAAAGVAERAVDRAPERTASGATAMRATPTSIDRITTIHPRTYNEAKTIGESFREGTPVIMNLTDMEDADAKRLVDFAAGLVFGLRGTIERVTNKVFLLSPANVTVTAEDKARMAESGFFNQS
ncbi:MAG: cell division protein SepF [Actinomycetota bacterium]|nr:cell division protein SepF [Actinomycetota bacterium]